MGCPEGLAKSVCAGTQKRKHYFGCNGRGSSFSHECVKLIPPRTPHPLTPNHLYQSLPRSCRELLNHLVARWGGRGSSSTPFSTSVYTCFLWLASTPLARALHCARVDSSGMYRSTTNCATNCKRLLPVSELWTHHLPVPFTTLPKYQLSPV